MRVVAERTVLHDLSIAEHKAVGNAIYRGVEVLQRVDLRVHAFTPMLSACYHSKARNRKVMIERQRVVHSPLTHDDEAHRVGERILLIVKSRKPIVDGAVFVS